MFQLLLFILLNLVKKFEMDVITIVGYFGALLIGIILGLIGGGGSILTVPVLVYILTIDPVLATAYSLFVVGASSLVGAIQSAKKKMVDYKTAVVFAIPALTAVFITRRFVVPAIPDQLFSVGDFVVTKSIAIMIFFALIMLAASYSMIKGGKDTEDETVVPVKFNYPLILAEGIVVGFLTGIVGAGGGFLIIPALVLLAKLPMKKAVATSLLIIAVKSLIGFIGDIGNAVIDWPFLLTFTSISIVGIFFGLYFSKFIDGQKLKKAFGWFTLIMGIYIVLKETVL